MNSLIELIGFIQILNVDSKIMVLGVSGRASLKSLQVTKLSVYDKHYSEITFAILAYSEKLPVLKTLENGSCLHLKSSKKF